eukprot:SAG31_NODE_108_length_24741_cov_6.933041_16_plen_85_part_00
MHRTVADQDFAGFKPGVGFVDKGAKKAPVFGSLEPFLEAGKCSALVKLLDDGSDIFISQETWTGLESMLRCVTLCVAIHLGSGL